MWEKVRTSLLVLFIAASLLLSCTGALYSCDNPMVENFGGVCR